MNKRALRISMAGPALALASALALALALAPGCDNRAAPNENNNNVNNNTNNAECNRWTHDYNCDGNLLHGCSDEGRFEDIDCETLGGICIEDQPVCRMPSGQCGESFDSVCITGTVVGHNFYGTCTLFECPAGQVCVEDSGPNPPRNGRCVLDSMLVCDAATYPHQCHDNSTVRYCNQGYVTEEICAADENCVDGRCRHWDSVPCEPMNFDRYCDGGATIDCYRDGYTYRTFCSGGLTCQVGDSGYPQCVIDPPTTCDESTFETQCIQDWAALVCYDGYETYTNCDVCTCDANGCECLLIG